MSFCLWKEIASTQYISLSEMKGGVPPIYNETLYDLLGGDQLRDRRCAALLHFAFCICWLGFFPGPGQEPFNASFPSPLGVFQKSWWVVGFGPGEKRVPPEGRYMILGRA